VFGLLLMNGVFAAALRGRVERVSASLVLVLVMLLGSSAHLAAYGWPLGYPMPGPVLYFLPFVMSVFLFVAGLDLAVAGLVARPRPTRTLH
jgi:hypothetical protein